MQLDFHEISHLLNFSFAVGVICVIFKYKALYVTPGKTDGFPLQGDEEVLKEFAVQVARKGKSVGVLCSWGGVILLLNRPCLSLP